MHLTKNAKLWGICRTTAFICCWEKYLQAGMWSFICFDALWEMFSERCLEKAQCHLSLILFWDHQAVRGNEQTVFKEPPLQQACGSPRCSTENVQFCSFLSHFPSFLSFHLSISSYPAFYSLLKIFLFFLLWNEPLVELVKLKCQCVVMSMGNNHVFNDDCWEEPRLTV